MGHGDIRQGSEICKRPWYPTDYKVWVNEKKEIEINIYCYLGDSMDSACKLGTSASHLRNHPTQNFNKIEREWTFKGMPEFDVAKNYLALAGKPDTHTSKCTLYATLVQITSFYISLISTIAKNSPWTSMSSENVSTVYCNNSF